MQLHSPFLGKENVRWHGELLCIVTSKSECNKSVWGQSFVSIAQD